MYAGCAGEIKNLDNILYENDGRGNFTAITGAALGDARGDIYGRMDAVLTADYDLDGRLDLLVTNGKFPRAFSYSGRQQLFRNLTNNSNHWVEIDLQGTISNRDGIGARVFATTPDGKVQLREQGNGMHIHSQNHQRLHIGLGQNRQVDLEVRWPSGVIEYFAAMKVDRLHRLVEGTGSRVPPGLGMTELIGVWRPSAQQFLLDINGNYRWDAGSDLVSSFGLKGDLPLVGDWNGDGRDEIGVWRPSNTTFYLDVNGNSAWDPGVDVAAAFGISSDVPLSGDWDGDGTDEIGVWRPGNTTFYLDFNGNFAWDPAIDKSGAFGISTDKPVVGDWDGDGDDQIGVWRADTATFYLDYNGNYQWNPRADRSGTFGLGTDVPLSGDWDGDGDDQIGVWRPSNTTFYLDANGNYAWDLGADISALFGATRDKPVVGRW